MSKQILISHSSKDNDSAQRVKKVLEDNGFSCWLDNDNIPPGADFVKKIAEAMRNCDVVVVLVSKNSQTSDWVQKEVTTASSQNKLIIPYMLQDFELNDEFSLVLGNAQRVSGYGDKEEEALRRVITAVHDYLQDVAEGEEIKITIEKNPARRRKQLLAAVAAVAALAVILTVILLPKGGGRSRHKDALEVYYSEVLPYSKAGYFQTPEADSGVVEDTIKTKNAFSILSFVRNLGDEAAFVEQISCDIDDLRVDDSPVITADSFIKDNRIRVFAYNDGWGDSKDNKYKITMTEHGNGVPLFDSIKRAVETEGTVSVASGSVALLAEAELSTDDIRTYCEDNEITFIYAIAKMYIDIEAGGETKGFYFEWMYDPKTDRITLFRGGKGDGPEYTLTLYAFLDVDEKPASVRFTGAESTPLVDNTFRIETVLIPNKSCRMICRGVYSVDGKTHVTDDFDVSVTVPIFREGATTDISPLTQDLFDVDMRDTITIAEIMQPYLYDPASVVTYSK